MRHSLFPRLWLMLATVGLACAPSLDERLDEARDLQAEGRFEASLAPLESLREDAPELAEVQLLLGLARLRTGKPSLAVWPLERASETPRLATRAGLLLAETALALKGYPEALRHLDAILAAEPDQVDALRLRATTRLAMGDREPALADAERLLALAPSYDDRLLHATLLGELGRLDEAQRAHEALAEAAAVEGPATEAKACLAIATFFSDMRRDDAEAKRRFAACLDAYPTDPLVLTLATRYLDAGGEHAEADRRWQAALAAAPGELGLELAWASRLAGEGDRTRAMSVLETAARRDSAAPAWLALAHLRRAAGETDAAIAAVEAARASDEGPKDDEELRLFEADLRVDAGDHAGARALAADFELPVYRDLIEGRILLAEGRPAEAQEAFQAGLLAWPNNAGARYGSGLAALALGRFDDALAQLREAVRIDAGATDAALRMAEIYRTQRVYGEAHGFAGRHLQQRDPSSEVAHRILVEASLALGANERAAQEIERFCARTDRTLHCAIRRAELARAREGPEAAARALEASDLDLSDPTNEEALRVQVQALVDAGRSADARAAVEAALAAHPAQASLHSLRGSLRLGSGDGEGARTDFEAALALDPDTAEAHAGLGALAGAEGRLEEARAELAAAAAADPSRSEYAYRAAQLEIALGQAPRAEARLRALVRSDPGHMRARNDLAWLLAESGRDLDLALALASEAVAQEREATTLDTLGWVRLRRSEPESALEAFEAALALRPDAAGTLYRAALAHKQLGHADRAIALLEQALTGPGFPQEEAARNELAALRAAPAT